MGRDVVGFRGIFAFVSDFEVLYCGVAFCACFDLSVLLRC